MKKKLCCILLIFGVVFSNSCIVFGDPTVPIIPPYKQILDINTTSIPTFK